PTASRPGPSVTIEAVATLEDLGHVAGQEDDDSGPAGPTDVDASIAEELRKLEERLQQDGIGTDV
ncbi:MAG: hypothetical protein ACR2QM_14980, partial [Longimicrobiales bacterium]